MAVKMTIQEFLAIRKEAGLKIDPETAEVDWAYAQVLDPYGISPPDEEHECIGRAYFARSRAVTFGSSLVTFPRQPEARCGKSTNGR
jgi:hypothetical protein